MVRIKPRTKKGVGLWVGLYVVLLGLTLLRSEAALGAAGDTIPDATSVYLPMVQLPPGPPTPVPTYDAIPVLGEPVDRPPQVNGDLNLALRGYVSVSAPLELIDLNGPTDGDAPQLAGLLGSAAGPNIVAAYQVRQWDWTCGADGCAGAPIPWPPVTLLGLGTTRGAPLFIPTRNQEIYGGGYKALVLYATPERITITYTREDTPAIGYLVHIEEIKVEPALVAAYEQWDQAGREQLPALRNGERLGNAASSMVKIAIRDTGSFMDPRSRKDWWKGW